MYQTSWTWWATGTIRKKKEGMVITSRCCRNPFAENFDTASIFLFYIFCIVITIRLFYYKIVAFFEEHRPWLLWSTVKLSFPLTWILFILNILFSLAFLSRCHIIDFYWLLKLLKSPPILAIFSQLVLSISDYFF